MSFAKGAASNWIGDVKVEGFTHEIIWEK